MKKLVSHVFKSYSENGGRLKIKLFEIDESTFMVRKNDCAQKIVHGVLKDIHSEVNNTSSPMSETVQDSQIDSINIHPGGTNTCDDLSDVNVELHQDGNLEFCINFLRKFNACPPDIELQSHVKHAEKHTLPKEGSELFLNFLRNLVYIFFQSINILSSQLNKTYIHNKYNRIKEAELTLDSENHFFYRACLSEMEPLDRPKVEEIMRKGYFWNEESEMKEEKIRIKFGPIYFEFAGQGWI